MPVAILNRAHLSLTGEISGYIFVKDENLP